MTLIYNFFIHFMLIFSFQLNNFAIVMLGEFLKKHQKPSITWNQNSSLMSRIEVKIGYVLIENWILLIYIIFSYVHLVKNNWRKANSKNSNK